MLMMIYMTRIQNMSFFLLKVNNPSVRHPVWPVGHSVWPCRAPPLAPPLAPVGHPVRPRLALRQATPSGHTRLATPSGHPSGPVWPPVRPRLAPVGHPVGHPVRPPSGRKKKKKNFFFFGCCCWLEKRAKNISVFNPQDPQDPQVPRAPRAPRALRAKPREEEGFFGLVPLVTHPSSIPLLGGLTPKFLSLSFHSL
jgi:hypothetical protein